MRELAAGDARMLGRYRLVGRLGEGGMGRVFVGVSPDGRLVAVKQVHARLAEDDDFRGRFRREVTTSRAVSGAYTAAVMDADPDAAVPWLASVFVPGPSLDVAVQRCGPLPAASVRVLAAGLAAALAEVHRAGLVHRDLKPSNVLLADDGPRVIDFGIARAVDAGTRLTQTGLLIGTPGYMSPEQVTGAAAGPASDVFSLGSVLVLACSGTGPFRRSSTPQLLYQVAHGEPELSGVPDPLRGLVASCLSKRPEHRPTPDQVLDGIGPVDPGQLWLPEPVAALIRGQRDEVRGLLSRTDVRGSDTAATALAPTRHAPTARHTPTPSTQQHHPTRPYPGQPVAAQAARPPGPGPGPGPPRRSRAGPIAIGVVLGVLVLLVAVGGTVGYRINQVPPVSYAGMPQECRSVRAESLERLGATTPDTDVGSYQNSAPGFTSATCLWDGDSSSLSVSIATYFAAQDAPAPEQRAAEYFGSGSDNLQNVSDDPAGEEAIFGYRMPSYLDVYLIARSGSRAVTVNHAIFATGDLFGDDAEAAEEARPLLRAVAENVLAGA